MRLTGRLMASLIAGVFFIGGCSRGSDDASTPSTMPATQAVATQPSTRRVVFHGRTPFEGIIRTRVGYAGGETRNPTYSHIGDHTETVQVDYDPRRITYEDLLVIFWESHSPRERAWGRQYMNAVFFHDEKQRLAAMASSRIIGWFSQLEANTKASASW